MRKKDYKVSLMSAMVGVSPIVTSREDSNQLRMLAERLKDIADDGADAGSAAMLQSVAQDTLQLLESALYTMQVSFVEMGDDANGDDTDNETYLAKLRAYRQKLSSPDPATIDRAHALLHSSKERLLSELDSRSKEMKIEVLDSLLSLSQTKIYGYRWIVEQLNEGLNSIAEDINVEMGAAFDVANELIGAEVKNVGNIDTQRHKIELDQTFENNQEPSEAVNSMDGHERSDDGNVGSSQSFLKKIRQRVTKSLSFLRSSNGNKGLQMDEAFKADIRPKIEESIATLKSFVTDSFNDYEESQGKQIELTLQAIDLEINECIEKMSHSQTTDDNKEEKRLYEQMSLMESQIASLKVLLASTIE